MQIHTDRYVLLSVYMCLSFPLLPCWKFLETEILLGVMYKDIFLNQTDSVDSE